MKRKMIILAIVVIFGLLCPSGVFAEKPIKTVEQQVNKVLDALRDPSVTGESDAQAMKDRIWTIAENMFDFSVVSRMTLGKKWKKLDASQQQEFTKLFSQVLANVYMDRVLSYSDEKVAFDNEKLLSKKKAQVDTRVITKSGDIPISYRLYDSGSGWKVYDVVIEGISMVRNYRGQFRQIPTHDLIPALRAKVS